MMTVYTIGYEGTDIDRFAATLTCVGIERLVDVRAVPLSRKKGFSKAALSLLCERQGIAYSHVVDLGDPKEGRDAARAGRMAEFRRIYGLHLSAAIPSAALDRVATLAASETTCLMCFERDPLTCHRSLIGDNLKGRGYSMFHLFGDNPSSYCRHAAKLPGRRSGQSAAAA